MADVLNLSSSH